MAEYAKLNPPQEVGQCPACGHGITVQTTTAIGFDMPRHKNIDEFSMNVTAVITGVRIEHDCISLPEIQESSNA